MGADWNDATKVGELIGIKILINEFVAYTELKALEGIISVSDFNFKQKYARLINKTGTVFSCFLKKLDFKV